MRTAVGVEVNKIDLEIETIVMKLERYDFIIWGVIDEIERNIMLTILMICDLMFFEYFKHLVSFNCLIFL